MAGPTSQRVGRGPCPLCAEIITYRRSTGGKLTFKCDDCGISGFCEPGELAHQKLMVAIVTRDPEPSLALAPALPVAQPAQPKTNSIFNMADL